MNITEWSSKLGLWLGGYKTYNRWNWDGKTTNPITVVLWAPGQPGGNENCLASSGIYNGETNDAPCTDVKQFICELVI